MLVLHVVVPSSLQSAGPGESCSVSRLSRTVVQSSSGVTVRHLTLRVSRVCASEVQLINLLLTSLSSSTSSTTTSVVLVAECENNLKCPLVVSQQ